MKDVRGGVCVCGGDLIPLDVNPDQTPAQAAASMAAALPRFLQQAGPSTMDTIQAWVHARRMLAVDLAILMLLERGEIECVDNSDEDEPRWAVKGPEPSAHPHEAR